MTNILSNTTFRDLDLEIEKVKLEGCRSLI